MLVSQFLQEVRAVVEQGWTQSCEARTAEGRAVNFDDSAAVSWCLIGAYFKVHDKHFHNTQANLAFDVLKKYTGVELGFSIAIWNDSTGRKKEEVLAALDSAIADPIHANQVVTW